MNCSTFSYSQNKYFSKMLTKSNTTQNQSLALLFPIQFEVHRQCSKLKREKKDNHSRFVRGVD